MYISDTYGMYVLSKQILYSLCKWFYFNFNSTKSMGSDKEEYFKGEQNLKKRSAMENQVRQNPQ